ncbi:OLC1v1005031C1 [Oldenlandia corymbosa var. corymbosa]|uniref:OLC1v1005031C1 n=1 Tax=Oldenlandia corymbosa var. corymbosa TaxID=529605 RepID=A0AAV1DE97_OLDCO|nr:OLC1v1005031C1 [Oldenlandia corymbosa var. corymbosa]
MKPVTIGGNPSLSNAAIDAAKKKTIDDAKNPVTSTVPVAESRLQEVPAGEASLSLDVEAAALVAVAEPQLQDVLAGEESIVVVDASDDTLPRLQEKDAAFFLVPLNQPSDDQRSMDVAAATESSPHLQNIDDCPLVSKDAASNGGKNSSSERRESTVETSRPLAVQRNPMPPTQPSPKTCNVVAAVEKQQPPNLIDTARNGGASSPERSR